MPTSSDTVESLFGKAKRHGTGVVKDANRIAARIPALCGTLTCDDARAVAAVSVKEQLRILGSMPSLIGQRRKYLSNPGSLKDIQLDEPVKYLELVPVPKSGPKRM